MAEENALGQGELEQSEREPERSEIEPEESNIEARERTVRALLTYILKEVEDSRYRLGDRSGAMDLTGIGGKR